MSGHSKWHSIKHKKAATDAKRGRLFTRLLKDINVAARMGGADIESNARLRVAVQAARDANMPKDNVEKAIKKASGEGGAGSLEDFVMEGYGPGGVAIIIEGTTDNRNRTTPEIRHMFGKCGGNLGEAGSVAWQFKKKGLIILNPEGATEESVFENALEAGAEDIENEDGRFTITTPPEDMLGVREALEAKGFKIESAETHNVPSATIKVEPRDAEKLLRLVSMLEDHDDVRSVAGNFDIDAELIEQHT